MKNKNQTSKQQRLYKDFAEYYDLVYYKKDYKSESKKLIEIISKYKKNNGNELLEVACGTGKHLEYFKKKFNCTGIDINKGILDIARKRFPNINFKKADMVNFKINKKFDIITCLFCSIGYVQNYKNLNKTLENFYKHLNPGGIVLIEPWFTSQEYKEGSVHIDTYDKEELKICRMSYAWKKANLSIIQMDYLIAEKNKGINHFSEVHKLGLFEVDKTLELLKKAGFKSKYFKKGTGTGRGIYVGIK